MILECHKCGHPIKEKHTPKDHKDPFFRMSFERYDKEKDKLIIDEDKMKKDMPYGHCSVCNDQYWDLPKHDEDTFFPCQFVVHI